jgi:hypothetical protein
MVGQYTVAGFDHIVLMNTGSDPDGFFDFFASHFKGELKIHPMVTSFRPEDGDSLYAARGPRGLPLLCAPPGRVPVLRALHGLKVSLPGGPDVLRDVDIPVMGCPAGAFPRSNVQRDLLVDPASLRRSTWPMVRPYCGVSDTRACALATFTTASLGFRFPRCLREASVIVA